MEDVCYFLVGLTSQDFDEGSQECLLWRLKDSENPYCKFIDEPSEICGGNTYNFKGSKAKKNCIGFEKEQVKARNLLKKFEELYSK